MAKATSINIKPATWKISEAHNERRGKIEHIIAGREDQHEHWTAETISSRLKKIAGLYQSKVGQKLQATASPIREGVVVIKEETTMDDLKALAKSFNDRFGIECFQIHIHKDEGRIVKRNEVRAVKALEDKTLIEGELILNLHAHMIFDWQNKSTGRSIKLNKGDTSEMQTIAAQVLGMVRGQENSKAVRLEVNEFKAFRERLNERVSKELQLIEDQKKNSLNELKALEAKMKETEETSAKLKLSYNQTLKKLEDSRMELKKLDSKFMLTRKLEAMPWKDCTINNVQWWLSLNGFAAIRIRSGQDGSIYFQHGEQMARLKDMSMEIQTIVKQKLSEDKIFLSQSEIKGRQSNGQRL